MCLETECLFYMELYKNPYNKWYEHTYTVLTMNYCKCYFYRQSHVVLFMVYGDWSWNQLPSCKKFHTS